MSSCYVVLIYWSNSCKISGAVYKCKKLRFGLELFKLLILLITVVPQSDLNLAGCRVEGVLPLQRTFGTSIAFPAISNSCPYWRLVGTLGLESVNWSISWNNPPSWIATSGGLKDSFREGVNWNNFQQNSTWHLSQNEANSDLLSKACQVSF